MEDSEGEGGNEGGNESVDAPTLANKQLGTKHGRTLLLVPVTALSLEETMQYVSIFFTCK